MPLALDTTRSYSRKDLEVFNLLKHPIWVFDIERKEMYWANTSALELWDAPSLQELLSRNFKDDLSEAAKHRMNDHLQRFRRGEVMKEQWTYYPNGKSKTVGVTGSGICIDGGRVAALAEAELPDADIQKSSAQSVEMLRHLPVACCQYDMQGKLEYQNPESVNLFGESSAEDPNEVNFLSRFVDKEVGKNLLQKVLQGEDRSDEAELYTKAGPRVYSIKLRRTKDPVTSDFIILFCGRDVTEVHRARQDQARANLKSEFMTVMAHEIRTPLAQIVGHADLLELTTLDDKQKEYVGLIQNSSGLLMSIINDLLDYQKIEDGKLVLDRMAFASSNLFQCCVAAVEKDTREKGLRLISNIASELPPKLIGDPNRVRQIFLNILSNAVKFTEEGSVSFSASVVKTDDARCRLRFEIADTGIGIHESQLNIIFDKYRQANASVARNYGGTGLGLAICKSLVDMMGGTIQLESELGKGSNFILELPFDITAEPNTVAKKRKLNPDAKNTAREDEESKSLDVLVVEDNKVNQKMVKAMLNRIGHNVTIAENGQIAIDNLKEKMYDLVLMDIQMPILDGIEATKQIRSSLGFSKTSLPVVGLTASYEHSGLGYYLEIGMNNCIGKPVKLNKLKRAISAAVIK